MTIKNFYDTVTDKLISSANAAEIIFVFPVCCQLFYLFMRRTGSDFVYFFWN